MIRQFLGFFVALGKNRFRDKEALFWSLAFPCVFLIIFGLVMTGVQRTPDAGSDVETQTTSIGIWFEDEISDSTQGKLIDLMKLMNLAPEQIPSSEALRKALQETGQEIEFGIVFEGSDQDLRLTILLDARRDNQNPFYQSISETFFQRAITTLSGFKEILDIKFREVPLTQQETTPLGFLLSGVLAVSISMSGAFSLISSLGLMRKKRVLKRIIATPAQGSTFIFADVVSTFVISAISCMILLVLSTVVFNISFSIHPLYFSLAFISANLIMIAFGGLFLLFFREPSVATGVVSVVTNIMIFFSGVYVPLEFLPDWLKDVAHFLPMIHIARTMRFSLGHDIMPMSEYWGIILVFLTLSCIWIPLIGYLTFRGERR